MNINPGISAEGLGEIPWGVGGGETFKFLTHASRLGAQRVTLQP